MSKRHMVYNKRTGTVLRRCWTRYGAERVCVELRSHVCFPIGVK